MVKTTQLAVERRVLRLLVFALSLTCPLMSGCRAYFGTFHWTLPRSHALRAEELQKEGKHREAISEYLAHIDYRNGDDSRPKDENPYFYYLLIGDCYLEIKDVDQAKKAYLFAQEKKVDTGLVNERLRRLGQWYEKEQRLDEALSTLQEYRTLDPLLFDLEIDRIHKLQVGKEEAEELKNRQNGQNQP